MPDAPLTPDAHADLLEPSRRQLHLTSGLAPTADVPPPARTKTEPPPCYTPCEACGALVLVGRTTVGVVVALDTGIPTYTALWPPETPRPVLHQSRGYPVHRCMSVTRGVREGETSHGSTAENRAVRQCQTP